MSNPGTDQNEMNLMALNQQVAHARTEGDAQQVAFALLQRANAYTRQGRIDLALADLDEAATIQQKLGHPYDEARCCQLAADLYRLSGKYEEAGQRARRAIALVPANDPVAVAAYAELGEIALAQGNAAVALEAYHQALQSGEAAGLLPVARAALLRKRATAFAADGQAQQGVEDLAAAYGIYQEADDPANARRVQVEQAAAWLQTGNEARTNQAWDSAYQEAAQAEDHTSLADLYLLKATHAVMLRQAENALLAAQEARKEALQARAPVQYISAGVTISQLCEKQGDRIGAYASLAVGWVTLGDLLGRDAARAAFEPKLLEMRRRWGEQAFLEVKAAYEAQRKEQMQKNG
jgi:tetratricopeptide (TPR) repeat protein